MTMPSTEQTNKSKRELVLSQCSRVLENYHRNCGMGGNEKDRTIKAVRDLNRELDKLKSRNRHGK